MDYRSVLLRAIATVSGLLDALCTAHGFSCSIHTSDGRLLGTVQGQAPAGAVALSQPLVLPGCRVELRATAAPERRDAAGQALAAAANSLAANYSDLVRSAALLAVMQAGAAATDVGAILLAAARQLSPLVPCQRLQLTIASSEGTGVFLYAVDTAHLRLLADADLVAMRGSAAEQVLRRRQTSVSDLAVASGWDDAALAADGMRTVVRLPLLAGGGAFAALAVASTAADAYGPADVAFLEQAAQQLAAGIGSARRYAELRRQATTDALTGVANRDGFNRLVEEQRHSQPDGSVGLILVGVAGLKRYNDRFGHLLGDRLLQDVARQLRETAEPGALVARFGGDEFVLVLPGANDITCAEAVARIRATASAYRTAGDEPLHLHLGVAVGTWGQVPELVGRADGRLHRARQRRMREQLAAMEHRLAQNRERQTLQTVLSLARMEELKDPYTSGHSERMRDQATRVAQQLGLSPEEQQHVAYGALLHDIGKVLVPREILFKPGPLTDEEYAIMQQHVTWGAEMVTRIDELRPVEAIILHHHERFDGSRHGPQPGYPLGLQGEEIPLGARIVKVVDAFDAMTSDRPYRPAMPSAVALAELRQHAGSQFDPAPVEALAQLLTPAVGD